MNEGAAQMRVCIGLSHTRPSRKHRGKKQEHRFRSDGATHRNPIPHCVISQVRFASQKKRSGQRVLLMVRSGQ